MEQHTHMEDGVPTAGVRIDLAWWPPEPDAPIGEARARELVASVRTVVGPILDEATADLTTRVGRAVPIERHSAGVAYFADCIFADELRALCLGTVSYKAGAVVQNAIQLTRDGVLEWRRCGRG